MPECGTVYYMEQRSPEWYAHRMGMITGSKMSAVMAGSKAPRRNYEAELVIERLTGESKQPFVTPEMVWGSEQEYYARGDYEARNLVDVDLVGFVDHPSIERSGSSPDGLVGTEGTIQVKCPTSANHLEVLETRVLKDDYVWQIQWELACTGRLWCDYTSYDPRMRFKELRMVTIRIERDEKVIAALEAEVRALDIAVNQRIERLRENAA